MTVTLYLWDRLNASPKKINKTLGLQPKHVKKVILNNSKYIESIKNYVIF